MTFHWHVGDVVGKLRHERHLTIVQLAARAKINKATVSRIERGEGDMKAATLAKLAKALKVELEDLWALIPKAVAAADGETRERDVLWVRLTPHARAAVLTMMRQLVAAAPIPTAQPPSAAHTTATPRITKGTPKGTKLA